MMAMMVMIINHEPNPDIWFHPPALDDGDVNNYDDDDNHYQQHDHEAGSRLSADDLETLDQYLSSDNKYNG